MVLEPATSARPRTPWAVRHVAGLVCFVVGLASLVVSLILVLKTSALFDQLPDWRYTVPLLVAAVVAAAACGVRREGHYGLAVAGVAMAAAGLALGWVLVLAAVAVVALAIIYVLSEVS